MIIQFILVLLGIILFIKTFNYFMDPRNGAGFHISEKNRVLAYESPSNWLGDGCDYEIYQFSDEVMKEIIETIENDNTWENYPIDSTTSSALNKWYGFIKNDVIALEIMKNSNLKDFIPNIENGYYLLVDRSSDEREESKNRYGLRNFTIFLLDSDKNKLYYIVLDM